MRARDHCNAAVALANLVPGIAAIESGYSSGQRAAWQQSAVESGSQVE
eukprot:COSAG06_NODE_23803_length_681_cov_0.886598_1_plen_47_part_10